MAYNRSEILSITETEWLSERKKLKFVEGGKYDTDEPDMEGYIIQLKPWCYGTTQDIKFGIDKEQNCCENWGYLTSEDDLSQFIGAHVIGIDLVDTALKVYPDADKAFDDNEESCRESIQFVNIRTSVGTLQLVAYNSHNGYYGHDVVLESSYVSHREPI